jgi:DNA-directed RNA polymerase subunit E'/Rpb7
MPSKTHPYMVTLPPSDFEHQTEVTLRQELRCYHGACQREAALIFSLLVLFLGLFGCILILMAALE